MQPAGEISNACWISAQFGLLKIDMKITLSAGTANEQLAQVNTALLSYWHKNEWRDFPQEVELENCNFFDFILANNIASASQTRPVPRFIKL